MNKSHNSPNPNPTPSDYPLGKNPKLNELMVLVAVAAATNSGNGYDLDEIKRQADRAAKLWEERPQHTGDYCGINVAVNEEDFRPPVRADVERAERIADEYCGAHHDDLSGRALERWNTAFHAAKAALLVSNRSGVEELVREQHEAMGDVMELRRISSSASQRAKADQAIAVWRKVETFLAERKNG